MPEFNNPVFKASESIKLLKRSDSIVSDIDYPSPQNISVGIAKFWKYLSIRDVLIFIVIGLMVGMFVTWTTYSSQIFINEDD